MTTQKIRRTLVVVGVLFAFALNLQSVHGGNPRDIVQERATSELIYNYFFTSSSSLFSGPVRKGQQGTANFVVIVFSKNAGNAHGIRFDSDGNSAQFHVFGVYSAYGSIKQGGYSARPKVLSRFKSLLRNKLLIAGKTTKVHHRLLVGVRKDCRWQFQVLDRNKLSKKQRTLVSILLIGLPGKGANLFHNLRSRSVNPYKRTAR